MKKLLISFFAIFTAATFVYAEAPNLFTYQGRLKENNIPVTGNRNIQIKMCDALTGGTCAPSAEQPFAVLNGLFKSTFTLNSVSFSSGELYIEVIVAGTILSPRERLASAPYAIHATTAVYASSLFALSGSDGVISSTSIFITDGDLSVAGEISAANIKITAGAAAGYILQSDASGNAAWVSPSAGAGDQLGNHIATTTLIMAGFQINNVSTITINNGSGGIALLPYINPTLTYAGDNGIVIGSDTYNNHIYGIGVGYHAFDNYNKGVGIGTSANNNFNHGVGVGDVANNNYDHGVGVGDGASDNHSSGVGIGTYSQYNDNYGVGLGAYSRYNDDYATGIGAYTTAASSSVALGSNAKANAKESLAIGAGTINNSTGTASFGIYAIETSSNIIAVGSITANAFYGDGSGLTGVTGVSAGSVAAEDVAAGVLGAGVIASSIAVDEVYEHSIRDDAITNLKIFDGAVTGGKISGNSVSSSHIVDGEIVNLDISAAAAIDYSKLAALTNGNILVGNVSDVATVVAMSGDITIDNTGVTVIGASKVTDSMLFGSIAQSKIVNLESDLAAKAIYADVATDTTTIAGNVAANVSQLTTVATDTTTLETNKLGTVLTSANIFVGNGSDIAAGVVMSGDATIDNAGAVTLATVGVAKGGTGLTTISADNLIYASGLDTYAAAPISAYGRSLIDDADAATARTTLGLVIGTNVLAPNGDGSALTNMTATQVSLGNVDNTSDANKPVSTAQQTALDGKAGLADVNTFTSSQTIKDALGLFVDYEVKAGSAAITDNMDIGGVIEAGSGNNQITTVAGLLDTTKLATDLAYAQVDGIVGQAANNLAAGDDTRFPAGADIVNADIGAAAAIVYSKLSIADSDLTIAKTSGLQAALDGKAGLADVNTFTSSQTIKDALGLFVDYEVKAGSAAITENMDIGGILNLTGVAAFSSSLVVDGNVVLGDNVADTVGIAGDATIVGALDVNGSVVMGDTDADTVNIVGYATFSDTVSIKANGLKVLGDTTAGTVLKNDGSGFAYWDVDNTAATFNTPRYLQMVNNGDNDFADSLLMQDADNLGITMVGASSMTIGGKFEAGGNVFFNSGLYVTGSSTFTSGAYFANISSFTAGSSSMFVNGGVPNQVLKKAADGSMVWANDNTGATINTSRRIQMINGAGNDYADSLFLQDSDDAGVTLLNSSTLTVTGNAFSVGGSTFVVTNGKVGIGEDTPGFKLTVRDTGSGAIAGLMSSGNSPAGAVYGWVNSGSASAIKGVTNGSGYAGRFEGPVYLTENIIVDGTMTVSGNAFSVGGSTFVVKNGYVGIGITNPTMPLHVNSVSEQYVFGGSVNGANAVINLVHNAGGHAQINDNSGTNAAIGFSINSINKMVVDNSGDIGIGTDSPLYRLHVSSGAGEAGNIVVISTGASNMISMTGKGEIYATKYFGDGSGLTNFPSDDLGNHIATQDLDMAAFHVKVSTLSAKDINGLFLLDDGGNGIFVEDGGNVGIGTISPLHPLHVTGNVGVQGTIMDPVGGVLELGSGSNDLSFSGGKMWLKSASGNVGIGITLPSSKFDVVDGSITIRGINAGIALETGSRSLLPETNVAYGAGIRISTNVYIVGFSSATQYYGDGSNLTGVGDDLGNHIAATILDMAGFEINNVSTITMLNGSIAIVPPGTSGSNANYGISIGSNSYGNFSHGVGVGYNAYNNDNWGVGVGYNAHGNHNAGAGVGYAAFGNYEWGVGVGPNASGNYNHGVGIGNEAKDNHDYAVGIGAFSKNNDTYGTGIGAFSQAASSAVAIGSYAKATAPRSLAFGAETVNNSTGTASFGDYAIVTSSYVGIGVIEPKSKLVIIEDDVTNPYIIKIGTSVTTSILKISTGGAVEIGDMSYSPEEAVLRVNAIATNVTGGEDLKTGIVSLVKGDGTGPEDILAAGNFEVVIDGGENAKAAVGIRTVIKRQNTTGGILEAATGLMIDHLESIGTIEETFGIFIATLTTVGVQTEPPYAIYSEDKNARTYLAGGLGINNEDPTAMLHISTGIGSADNYMLKLTTGTYDAIKMNAWGEIFANTYYGDGSKLTNLTGDSLGTHVATTTLDMVGFDIVNIGSMTINNGEGGISIAPSFTPGERYSGDNGIAIGESTFNNYFRGVGIGMFANGNYDQGIGVGFMANNNHTSGVGVGDSANNNNNHGVGVGAGAFNNHTSGVGVGDSADNNNNHGVGVGAGASNNYTYGVGVGAYARYNDDYAVGIGAYSQNNKTYGTGIGAYSQAASSSVAIGSYAKTTAGRSLAFGFGTVNNSTETANFGIYAIETSSDIIAVGSITANAFFGDGSNLINVPGDGLGDHTAMEVLKMGIYGINTSSDISAASYQINGSTVVSLLGGINSLGIGIDAGRLNTGIGNSFLGSQAGYFNTTGNYSSFVGNSAGHRNNSGRENCFLGYRAGYENTTGERNSFFGYQVGYFNTTGNYNSFFGIYAGYSNETGTNNTFMGSNAGQFNVTGSNNAFVGQAAGYNALTGSANSILGVSAGHGVPSQSFSSSTLMGYQAGYGLSTGSDNIFLGFKAGYNVTTGSGNIIIGYEENALTPDTSNYLNIGGIITGDISTGEVNISGVDGIKISSGGAITTRGIGHGHTAGGIRGMGAVDLQTVRSFVDEVASGDYSVLGGGLENTASGNTATVSGGILNTASNYYATIAGGYQNTANNNSSTVSGGSHNLASGYTSTISGGELNVSSGIYSAVGGGKLNESTGAYSVVGGGYNNFSSGDYSGIGGGYLNTASSQAATVSGGLNNISNGNYGAVSGGMNNKAGEYGFVGSGYENTASGVHSAIAGGWFNNALAESSFIGGGAYHTIDAEYATVSGGSDNKIISTAYGAAIGGGFNNISTGAYSNIGGGFNNVSSGTYSSVGGGYKNKILGAYSVIGGGNENEALGENAFIGGGRYNDANASHSAVGGGYMSKAIGGHSYVGGGFNNEASGSYSSVSGGTGNLASGDSSNISGGQGNVASGNFSNVNGGFGNDAMGYYAIVGGGKDNIADGWAAIVGGGELNKSSGNFSIVMGGEKNTSSGTYTFIGGGYQNFALGNYSFIGGGYQNVAFGSGGTVPGGFNNYAGGNYSFAAGYKSSSTAQGTFTWSDSEGIVVENNMPDRTWFKTKGGFLVTGSTKSTDGGLNVVFNGSSATVKVNGDLALGNGINEGGNKPIVVWLKNNNAGPVTYGDIVIIDANMDNAFNCISIPSTTSVLGVVYGDSPASVIGSGAIGKVAIHGVVEIRTANPVTRGESVVTSGISCQADSTNNPINGTGIGKWLESGGGAGTLRKAVLIGH